MTIEHDVDPPSPTRAARRAMVLAAVVCRSFSESNPESSETQDLWENLKAWIADMELGDELEPLEQQLIFAPLGTLLKQNRIDGTWRTEGLSILAWSLGLAPFPAHDEQQDPFAVTDSVYFLSDDAMNLVRTAELRSADELDACREWHYAVHCRLRAFCRERRAQDIRHWIEPEWNETLQIESILGDDGDLEIGGVPLSKADEERWQACESIICERHRASIWLVGDYGPGYCEIPVDT